MSEPTEIEKKSLEAHVELCAERYRFLEQKLENMENKITSMSTAIQDIHDGIMEFAEKRNNQLMTFGIGQSTHDLWHRSHCHITGYHWLSADNLRHQMNQKKVLERLQDIVAMDLNDMAKNVILPDGAGYQVFEIYSLQPVAGQWQVGKRGDIVSNRGSLKSAVSWCVADKYNQIRLGMDIIDLDRQCQLTKNDIEVRSLLQKKIRDVDLKSAVNIKITTRQLRLRVLGERLEKCINRAKYLQIRGFNNETARSGRTSSNRTSR